ncbi:type III secretion system export apparatus subunit SctR [uncultured Tateyamaria sp.]|uniref:type III secretion system export apparatus subunit SctR n=1 Tax=uncultured Tateyamaria sp. TaxID=455651 RepID=UPI0026342842|nr:type III secretion system export apparatus subunit SctR [uncultured Tateyamaria sp.]
MTPDQVPSFLPLLFLVVGLSFIPFLGVMATSFTKIVIVLMLLRNALGTQTAPSTLVINSIALSLTIFIMAPIGLAIEEQLTQGGYTLTSWEEANQIREVVSGEFVTYLSKFAGDSEIEFFISAALDLWPEPIHDNATEDSLLILLPAHISSELTRAFQIAFLIFLPFVAIDMIVSNILLAMGAMMVPPMLVSLPLKLLVFVSVDGWSRLLQALILSYAE